VTVQSRSLSIISSELNTFSVAVRDEGERLGRDMCINGFSGMSGKKKERKVRTRTEKKEGREKQCEGQSEVGLETRGEPTEDRKI
jgi:hypothetical protein